MDTGDTSIETLMSDTDRLKEIILSNPKILASTVDINHSTNPDNPRINKMPLLRAITEYSGFAPFYRNNSIADDFVKNIVLPSFDKLSRSDQANLLNHKDEHGVTFMDAINEHHDNGHVLKPNVYLALKNHLEN
ncbi:MAG: hypothetical protein HRT47_08735 [Candidatus Caenarcaniphilales bacterium]|nr:hypothetical protein [Candidatus Caenarcaniphilales bacterium]